MTLGTSSGAAAAPLGVEEWAAFSEEHRVELVRGNLVEEEVPSYVHEAALVWLMELLLGWCRANGARVVGSGLRYALTEDTGRSPDLSVFLAGSCRPPARGAARTPPSIAVEIISPTPSDARRDRIEKLSEYAAFGVRWYWLVDPELRSVEILELNEDRHYVHVVNATGGTVSEVPGCPGLQIPVDDLWCELDEAIAEAGEH